MELEESPQGSVSERCRYSPGEARTMELVCTVSCQIREMEASRVKDQGGQINHVAVREKQDVGLGPIQSPHACL